MKRIIIEGKFNIKTDLPVFKNIVKDMKRLVLEVDELYPIRPVEFLGIPKSQIEKSQEQIDYENGCAEDYQ